MGWPHFAPTVCWDKRNAVKLNLQIAGGVFHKIHMALSWVFLNTPLKCLLFEVAQWQMQLQVSHIFTLSDTAFCLITPFGGFLVFLQLNASKQYVILSSQICQIYEPVNAKKIANN